MAAKLSTGFLGHEWVGSSSKSFTIRLSVPSRRLLPVTCKARQRNLSSQHKGQVKKKSSSQHPQTNADLRPNADDGRKREKRMIIGLNKEISPNEDVGVTEQVNHNIEVTNMMEDENNIYLTPSGINVATVSSDINCISCMRESSAAEGIKPLRLNGHSVEQLPNAQLEDFIIMLKKAEKNVLLLNEARVRALEDLENILREKEALQGEMNVLKTMLAETLETARVSSREKMHAELLQEHVGERGRYNGGGAEVSKHGMNGVNTKISRDENHQLLGFHTLNDELNSLRTENMSLKDSIEELRTELKSVKRTSDQVTMLVNENSHLEAALRDLDLQLTESQHDITELSSTKFECKSLSERVENLQALFDKASKQADQAQLMLQHNQELYLKVDRLEEFHEVANVYKLSSEEMQNFNERMHQRVKLLEERLERSDEDIQSYFQLYQAYIEEFQATLNCLLDESKKRSRTGPVDDMPREFWSSLLLQIDGWSLEKKLQLDDADKLRDMVWKRDRRIYDAYMACKEKSDHDAFAAFSKLTSTPISSALHIIHIAAEMAPVAKVGGLADVVTGLSKAHQKKGHLVEIVLPKYDCMQYDQICNLRALDVVVESYFDGMLFKNKIWVGTVEGLPVYFIEPLHPSKFFWRAQYYGENDDFKRFSYFSRAALELLLLAGKKPDIIHCHDWQTAFVAPLYWDIYSPKGLSSARICFTCHNFEYQGAAPAAELISCGLDVHRLNRPDRMQDNSSHDRINPIKGAIVFSNIVTTVSPTYAQEVQTPEGGRGLHGILSSHSKKFVGILNGIDTDTWNPSTDEFLKVQYNSTDLHGKLENKQALRGMLGLSSANVKQPLVGCVTRLVPQKGIHLIRHAIYRTMELGGQFVLLGSSPVHHIQMEFECIANQLGNHNNARLLLKYDDSLSHAIYAASDMFIIPSMFEPCGLTQMIAMKYGAIPIARKTGGLSDSVFDVDDDTVPPQFRNGFSFFNPDEEGLNSALDRALHRYKSDQEGWMQLVQKVMSMDFSWELSASQYVELYEKALARGRATRHS